MKLKLFWKTFYRNWNSWMSVGPFWETLDQNILNWGWQGVCAGVLEGVEGADRLGIWRWPRPQRGSAQISGAACQSPAYAWNINHRTWQISVKEALFHGWCWSNCWADYRTKINAHVHLIANTKIFANSQNRFLVVRSLLWTCLRPKGSLKNNNNKKWNDRFNHIQKFKYLCIFHSNHYKFWNEQLGKFLHRIETRASIEST